MTMLYKGFTFLQIILIIVGTILAALALAAISAMAIEVYENINHHTVRKISSDGEQIWKFSGHSNRVSSVHVDNQGNVYSRSEDYGDDIVRKINKEGKEEWKLVKDEIITVDQGFIYTKSSDGILQKIDNEGEEVWNIDVGEARIQTVDNQGNVYGILDNDTLQKISNNGEEWWTFKKEDKNINLVNIDSQGDVYIGVDNSIQKINSIGQVMWTFEEDPSNDINSIKVDSQGNVYRYVDNSPARTFSSDPKNYTIQKISPQGEKEWSFNSSEYISSTWKVDSQGNLYINTDDDVLWKIDSNGEPVWKFNDFSPYRLIETDQGNIYGSSSEVIKKINSNGKQMWEFDRYSRFSAFSLGIVVDNQENIYITADHNVWKINSEGEKEWKFDGNVDDVSAMVIDKQGNVYTGSGEMSNSF